MAVNAFIKIDGVSGPSQVQGMSGYIDILSFSWGASMPTTSHTGGLAESTGRPDFHEITIMKALDSTSPNIFSQLTGGKRITGHVTLAYAKAMGDKPETYFSIKLTGALITSMQLSGSNENPTESVSFHYQKIDFSYSDEKGGSLQGAVTKTYDLMAQKIG